MSNSLPKDKLVHLRVILKSGVEFTIKTENYCITHGRQINEFTLSDCVENFPVYLDLSEVAAVVRIFSNEIVEEEEEDETDT